MNSERFIDECKFKITFYHNDKVSTLKGENDFIQKENVHCVWFNKSIQNFKGLFITIPLNGRYYECTYNGDSKELYLDIYKKEENLNFEEEN